MTRWLDQEWIIRWATSRGIETDAKQLGALTLSVLKGKGGNQRKEAVRLAKWVEKELNPHVINFSNMLISGAAPLLKERTGRPIVVTLQGDDIFMDDLPEPYRSQCFEQVRRIVPHIDGFIVFSQFYADYMSEYFSIPREKFHIVTLGIDLADFPLEATERLDPIHREPTIGYLARMAPEKGLHLLVDAFMHLRSIEGMARTRLKIAGWAGKQQQPYVNEQLAKLKSAGHIEFCEYLGTIDRQQKLTFLSSIDVMSVPTIYRDPKGLFVLEALAAGVPVVQPEHGAFPELIRATGGGHLVPPLDPVALAEKLAEVLTDRQATHQSGLAAAELVRTRFNSNVAATETIEIYRMLVGSQRA